MEEKEEEEKKEEVEEKEEEEKKEEGLMAIERWGDLLIAAVNAGR